MEFDVEKDVLRDALLVSGIENEIAIRALFDHDGISGIFFTSHVDTSKSIGLVANYGIFDVRVSYDYEWPHVSFSCTDQLIRAVKSLPTGEDKKLKVRIFIKTVGEDKVNVESRIIICGAGKANIELRTQRPEKTKPSEVETSCFLDDFLKECR